MNIAVIFVGALVVLTSIGVIGKYVLFDRGTLPVHSEYRISLQEICALARSQTDELPLRLNSIAIAEGVFPKWGVAAGGAAQDFPTNFTSFQVVYKDKTVIIDAPFTKAQFEKLPFGTTFHDDRFAAMQHAMQQAEHIVVTHEHGDHISGITQ